MTLRHMRIFVAVCECGSVTGAAEKLYLAQPAVSAAVRELERYYGVRLFDRMARRLYITEQGRRVLSYAMHITALFDEMEQGIRDSDHTGVIRVGTSITIGSQLLPGLARRFRALYPEIRLWARVDRSEAVERLLLENELDFGLIEGEAHSEFLIAEQFLEDRLAVVCAPGCPLCGREAAPEELARWPLLLRERGSGTRALSEGVLGACGVPIEPAWESVSTSALIRAAEEGLGIAVLPVRLVEERLRAGTLGELKLAGADFSRKFRIVYHKHKYLSPSVQRFLGLCRELRQSDAGDDAVSRRAR